MSKVQTLRVFMKQRLTAAAEEIFELFERTIAEYEEELCRQRKLLDAVFKPQVQLHRTGRPNPSAPPEAPQPPLTSPDVQQQLNKEEDPPEQQERSSSLDQEDPPELPHIKEEQEELWTRQEGEQLPGLEEADIKVTLTPVTVKSGEDDEELQSSQLHQIKTEEIRDGERLKTKCDGEDCGGPEPDRNLNTDVQRSVSKDEVPPEQQECCSSLDQEEPEPPHITEEQEELWTNQEEANLTKVTFTPVPVKSDDVGEEAHVKEKPFPCSECGRRFKVKYSLTQHMAIHSGERPFSCSECGKRFKLKQNLTGHMVIHSGERPFRCSECGKRFTQKGSLTQHMAVHSGERPFSCSVCGKRFKLKQNLTGHMAVHSGEKPFSCSECGTRFKLKGHLKRHMTCHSGETV
ncbi:zinc finger protein 501-like isoform X2 [Sparus aurata]|uniref:zinc finger protein 501-like isoform X2 n=1 Tax=Sparus aurata TaxID=8175 RepID=UPI0011C1A6D5|nr:zinc finger protein 501-like isoform X2 [Sparus aurata]